jgi:hypothetical protein
VNVRQAMLTDKEIRQYFDEAVTQTVAGSIAEAFNHLATDRGLCVAVKMLPVSVVSLPQLVALLKSHARPHAHTHTHTHARTHTERERDRQTDRQTDRHRRMHARTHARTHARIAHLQLKSKQKCRRTSSFSNAT